MKDYVVLAVLLPGPLLLVHAATAHIARGEAFVASLQQHRLWGGALVRPMTILLPVGEAVVGGGTLLVVLFSRPESLPPWALAVVVTYGAFGAYAWWLWRRRPGAPCGCSARAEPVSGAHVTRALALAVGAGLGALEPATVHSLLQAEESAWATMLFVVLAGCAVSLIGWMWPSVHALRQDFRVAQVGEVEGEPR